MAATPLVRFEPDDVHARLGELSLTEGALHYAAQRWNVSLNSFTPNHPSFMIGITAWGEGVAGLREAVMPTGWTRSDENNFALVVSPDGMTAISVATGDHGTGRPYGSPSNKAPKGSSTIDAVSANVVQLGLFDDLVLPFENENDSLLTWLLLLHRAPTEIRCELSLPLRMSARGRVTDWKERIVLSSIPLDDTTVELVLPQGPDFDIEVKRKA